MYAAALGLAQLERIDELIEKKRKIFTWYKKELSDLDNITLNYESQGTKNSYWMVTAILEPRLKIEKERLIELLGNKNINCRPFFYPLSSLPAYCELDQAKVAMKRNEISYRLSPYGINLPSALNMTEDKVRYVCTILKESLRSSSQG